MEDRDVGVVLVGGCEVREHEEATVLARVERRVEKVLIPLLLPLGWTLSEMAEASAVDKVARHPEAVLSPGPETAGVELIAAAGTCVVGVVGGDEVVAVLTLEQDLLSLR